MKVTYKKVIKIIYEEARIEAKAVKVITIQDGNLHNYLRYTYGITKTFIKCEYISGDFVKNIETIDSGYFSLDNLPELATEKVNEEQIKMCFAAHYDKHWQCLCD